MLPTAPPLRMFAATPTTSLPGGPSPCPCHDSTAFGYDAASALPPVRWHARAPLQGVTVWEFPSSDR